MLNDATRLALVDIDWDKMSARDVYAVAAVHFLE
jgi:hypothetical protein